MTAGLSKGGGRMSKKILFKVASFLFVVAIAVTSFIDPLVDQWDRILR